MTLSQSGLDVQDRVGTALLPKPGALPAAPGSPAPAGAPAPGGPEAAKLRRTAEEFEAVFLRMLLQNMLPEDGEGLFGGGPGAGMVRGMFVDQVGGGLAKRRALGIADLIERTMTRAGHSPPVPQVGADAAETGRPLAAPAGAPVDLRA